MENDAPKQYSISDVCKMVGVEAHVLRYWEKELGLEIPRNQLGHRYYLDWHISMFTRVRDLKASGYQLKAIKNQGICEKTAINANVPESMASCEIKAPENAKCAEESCESSYVCDDGNMEKFKISIAEAVLAAVRIGNRELSSLLGNRLIKQMDSIMQLQEEMQEERFRKLDETIRNCQRDRKESAKEQKKFRFILH